MKGVPDIIIELKKDPRILEIMEKHPEITPDVVGTLYKRQWIEIASFLREKKGYNLAIPGLGYFKFKVMNIPHFLSLKIEELNNMEHKFEIYEKNEYLVPRIEAHRFSIDQTKSIVLEFYKKHPIHAAAFRQYWKDKFLTSPRNFRLASLLRGILADIDIQFSEEEYQRRYSIQEKYLQQLSESTDLIQNN